MMRKQGWVTAVTVLLLLILAACGGGAVDEAEQATDMDTEAGEAFDEGMEATGSEDSGVILPTPIQGAKVPPAQSTPGAAENVPALDILLIVETPLTQTINLEAVADWAITEGFDTQIGLILYGETEPIGVYPLTPEYEALTAVLSELATPLDISVTLATALDQATTQAGWRTESTNRYLVSLLNTAVATGDEPLWQQAAQETNSHLIHLAPLINEEMDATQTLLTALASELAN